MQTLIFFFNALFPNVLSYRFFAPFMPHSIGKISLAPKFASPQNLFYLRHFLKYFSRRNTFHCLYYSIRTPCRNTLYKKMHMVPIGADFKKYHLISFPNLQANILNFVINFFAENHSPVFCRTNKVIQQNRNIMPFMDIFAHA